jgi:hypothetical protein
MRNGTENIDRYIIKFYYKNMNKHLCLIIGFLIINGMAFSDGIKGPTPPIPPTPPIKPVVPGASNNTSYPKFPTLPSIQNNNQEKEVTELKNYELIINRALLEGDSKRNVSNTIKKIQYILYSNRNITLKIDFTTNLQYIYYLKNQGSKIEISPGINREVYDTVIQAGKEFLLDQYISEINISGDEILSITIIDKNKVIVIMDFKKNG